MCVCVLHVLRRERKNTCLYTFHVRLLILIAPVLYRSNVEITRGNILRGGFTLSLFGSGSTSFSIPWDTTAAGMVTILQNSLWPGHVQTVAVSRSQQDKVC